MIFQMKIWSMNASSRSPSSSEYIGRSSLTKDTSKGNGKDKGLGYLSPTS